VHASYRKALQKISSKSSSPSTSPVSGQKVSGAFKCPSLFVYDTDLYVQDKSLRRHKCNSVVCDLR
jgi:hypothetical protein